MTRKKSTRRKPARRGSSKHTVEATQVPLYCTRCGASLENFSFSGSADDLRTIRRNLELCKKIGKFSGELCAKLFIALPVDVQGLLDDAGDENNPA